jgi:hypothetical protein
MTNMDWGERRVTAYCAGLFYFTYLDRNAYPKKEHSLRPGWAVVQALALVQAIDEGTLGQGSIAGDEYLEDMENARFDNDAAVTWVEVCFCATPLAEERPYWEKYFELLSIRDAHARNNCRDFNGTV